MFSRIRNRLHLTPSMAIAFVALVLALTGGAFAATPHGGGGATATAAKSKAKPKAKAGPRGPAGPAGKTGATGATGPAGATGPGGAAGAKGETGGAGVQGVQGETGATGPQGPIGDTGVQGPQGEPWTPNNTLPANAKEKGTWSVAGVPATYFGKELVSASISFTIPLEKPIAEAEVHIVTQGETIECPGGVEKPEALPGNLCIFIQASNNAKESDILDVSPEGFLKKGAGTVGTTLLIEPETAGEGVLIFGSWAVTAPAAS